MLPATLVQPMENSEAAPKQISKACPITAYSSGRKRTDIQQFSTCKIGERHRGPPELNGLTSRGGSRGEIGSSSLSLLPEPSPKQDVRPGEASHGHPADGGLDSHCSHGDSTSYLGSSGLVVVFLLGRQRAYPASLSLTHLQCSLLAFKCFLGC